MQGVVAVTVVDVGRVSPSGRNPPGVRNAHTTRNTIKVLRTST